MSAALWNLGSNSPLRADLGSSAITDMVRHTPGLGPFPRMQFLFFQVTMKIPSQEHFCCLDSPLLTF